LIVYTFRNIHLFIPSTTSDTDDKNETFKITHPFHPLSGRKFKIATYRHNWGQSLVYYQDDNGRLCSVPVGWTSIFPPDPLVCIAKGRSPFRVADLLELSRLIQGILIQESELNEDSKEDAL
jgi:hypothetical protein